jgi:hypothetical protein
MRPAKPAPQTASPAVKPMATVLAATPVTVLRLALALPAPILHTPMAPPLASTAQIARPATTPTANVQPATLVSNSITLPVRPAPMIPSQPAALQLVNLALDVPHV